MLDQMQHTNYAEMEEDSLPTDKIGAMYICDADGITKNSTAAD
jgi:hypothetical protein